MNKMKYLLLLGANQFQRERALIGAERAYNGPVVICQTPQQTQSNNFASWVMQTQSETDPEILIDAVLKFNQKYYAEPEAVIPLNDFVLNSSVRVAKAFSLATNGEDVANKCRNKIEMKKCLFEGGSPVVLPKMFENKTEALQYATSKMNFPVVVKPLNFGGSGGVKKAANILELSDAIDETLLHLHAHAKKYNSEDQKFLIEDYIVIKNEISVEVLNSKQNSYVLGITQKYLGPEPYFAEIGHLVPSPLYLNETINNKIKNEAIKACKNLGIQMGIAHVEMKVSESGELKIIEVGARTAGDGIMDLWEKSSNLNFYQLHCESYLSKGNSKPIELIPNRVVAIGYFCPPPGIVSAITPVQNIKQNKSTSNIDQVNIRTSVGERIVTPKDWSTRSGFVTYIFNIEDLKHEIPNIIEITKSMSENIFNIDSKDN